ncbi:MAG: PepSY domain-containing protein [Steroidobacteraceae bacterium]
MRLPRTEATLAAVLLLSAAPFALAAPPPANPPPASTSAMPGAMAPQTQQTPQTESGMGWSHSHTMMRHRSSEPVPQADIEAAKSVKVSLTDAIGTAEQQNHGKVVSARFEMRHGKPEYLIRTFDSQSQKEWLGHIDANTGQISGKSRSIALSQLPMEDQKELTASANAGTSLAQAVQSAEQQRGGKALAAGLSEHDGHVSYRTELLKSNGSTQVAMISPESGKVSEYR